MGARGTACSLGARHALATQTLNMDARGTTCSHHTDKITPTWMLGETVRSAGHTNRFFWPACVLAETVFRNFITLANMEAEGNRMMFSSDRCYLGQHGCCGNLWSQEHLNIRRCSANRLLWSQKHYHLWPAWMFAEIVCSELWTRKRNYLGQHGCLGETVRSTHTHTKPILASMDARGKCTPLATSRAASVL